MLDWALDANHDISFTNGDIAMVAGADRVKQSILIQLRMFLGEWFDDVDAWVPYFQYILAKAETYQESERGVSARTVEAILRQKILEVEGVEAITSFSLELNATTRSCSVEFEAKSSEGVVTVSEVFP